ncbi:DUF6922 domain-containing protein [Arcicella rigui]|uniref:DUF6922 domain-containing protein n=1 Tax=Arcicella rigui TaxID=797020 RepID=A0ABU5QD35_9BACT|nr:hypothetical protein [Arcicella rigui]MEA5140763.1 hypothetical protein [Arcicella rigui]
MNRNKGETRCNSVNLSEIYMSVNANISNIMEAKRVLSKPNISQKAFWDVDFERIDFEKNSVFVIDKVFNYGVFSDQLELIRFYGFERIKNDIVKIAYFRKPVFAFVSSFFDLDKSLFKAYQRRQEQPNHWDF